MYAALPYVLRSPYVLPTTDEINDVDLTFYGPPRATPAYTPPATNTGYGSLFFPPPTINSGYGTPPAVASPPSISFSPPVKSTSVRASAPLTPVAKVAYSDVWCGDQNLIAGTDTTNRDTAITWDTCSSRCTANAACNYFFWGVVTYKNVYPVNRCALFVTCDTRSTYVDGDIVYSHYPVDAEIYNCKYNIFGHFHRYPQNMKDSLVRRYKGFFDFKRNFTFCIVDWEYKPVEVQVFLKKCIDHAKFCV
jgi:hypothetical protein